MIHRARKESSVPDRSASLGWRLLVPVTALGAGLLFATSAATAQGTDLRAGRFSQLTELIDASAAEVQQQVRVAAALQQDVTTAQRGAAASSTTVGAETTRGDDLAGAAGLLPVQGPGLTVHLDDAPRAKAGDPPASDNPDDLVVHQQDVQSVINALWAGGAEALTVMGERIISTTAVRCVGNTLLVQGRLVGPPFIISAIGDPQAMRSALDVEPGVALFERYVEDYGLGYRVSRHKGLRFPAYDGPLELPHVERAAR